MRIVLALSLVALLAPGCFRARQEARQIDAVAYLLFTGNAAGSLASLEADGGRIWENQPVVPRNRYAVKPGVYRLTVTRGGALVVDRRVFLGDQQVFEVRVP